MIYLNYFSKLIRQARQRLAADFLHTYPVLGTLIARVFLHRYPVSGGHFLSPTGDNLGIARFRLGWRESHV